METELTKKMKQGVVFFNPLMPTQMRTIRYAYEVWTPTGIVDAIRFEDYQSEKKDFCYLIDYQTLTEKQQKAISSFTNGRQLGECKIDGLTFPNPNCHGCAWKSSYYEIGMCITCYECKISLSDFKSKNGHNFHGNYNYYVVPNDLVDKIKDLVPENIGIISYYEKTNSFRIKKKSPFQEIDSELKVRLLYDAFKKWVDKYSGTTIE